MVKTAQKTKKEIREATLDEKSKKFHNLVTAYEKRLAKKLNLPIRILTHHVMFSGEDSIGFNFGWKTKNPTTMQEDFILAGALRRLSRDAEEGLYENHLSDIAIKLADLINI